MQTAKLQLLIVTTLAFVMAACGSQAFQARMKVAPSEKTETPDRGELSSGEPLFEDELEPPPSLTAPEAPSAAPLKICSKLPFSSKLVWPQALPVAQRDALKLALNISGSFEGSRGWANLTGDFDGMGVSLGLLNQNLGSGSLQPMLLQMRDLYPSALKRTFSPAHLSSLLKMLKDWEAVHGNRYLGFSRDIFGRLSLLDEDRGGVMMALPKAEQASVTWARANLFSGKKFNEVWAKELKAMAETPEYISIQINRALDYHDEALALIKQTKNTELRSYLLMFDFVVQNGGLYQEDLTDYRKWSAANPSATQTQRLSKILELRLRHVRAAYVTDVRIRKTAIINGKGTVHKADRNLETEYCFQRLNLYPL